MEMRSDRFKTEFLPAAVTALGGLATLAASLHFGDFLPTPKHTARVVGLSVLYLGMALFVWVAFHVNGAIRGSRRASSG